MCQPESIRIEKEEEHDAKSHQVHVDHQQNASVIKTPASPHTAEVIDGSSHGGEDRQDQERGGMVVRKIGEQDRDSKADENQERASKQRTAARVEEPVDHLTLSKGIRFFVVAQEAEVRNGARYHYSESVHLSSEHT